MNYLSEPKMITRVIMMEQGRQNSQPEEEMQQQKRSERDLKTEWSLEAETVPSSLLPCQPLDYRTSGL